MSVAAREKGTQNEIRGLRMGLNLSRGVSSYVDFEIVDLRNLSFLLGSQGVSTALPLFREETSQHPATGKQTRNSNKPKEKLLHQISPRSGEEM